MHCFNTFYEFNVKTLSLCETRYIIKHATKHASNTPEYMKALAVPKLDCNLPPIIAPSD